MSEASLPEVQRWMQDAVRFPGAIGAEEIERRFLAGGRFDAADGLAVYQRGYFLRLASCMREQFPALCHALGRELFDDFVADYVREKPPESHTLYDLGRRFAGFLEESRPDRDESEREGWIDFMVDLACFERQVFALFDAPGHEGKAFAGPETADERLRLQPAFALGAYLYPVHLYYHSVRRGEAAALPPAERSFVALVRTDYVTRTIPLAEPHHVFLSAMAGGGGVEAGLEAVARHLAASLGSVRASWRDEAGVRRRWLDWGFFIARG
ncbi:MAG: putative DNA-binding domain-containing protein [Allosphingosinicella sp.]